MGTPITSVDLEKARDQLLTTAVGWFRSDVSVLGIFLEGSVAAESADAYSDIDLRIVVEPEQHQQFVEKRRDIPAQWPGFLFNEWLPNTQHCVSHFLPFGKIDIFYYDATRLVPSPWYRLPIRILYDPQGIIAAVVEQSAELKFAVRTDDLDGSISKGLAAAHETYRRVQRGELFYALTLLDELRYHMMQADDWLYDRIPETTVIARFERRGSERVRRILQRSYCPCNGDAILEALDSLVSAYRNQVLELHKKFQLSRPLENDIAALDVLGRR